VQCIYCQQIRAKNTSRQKQHLLECPGLRGHPNAPQPQASGPGPNGIGPTNGYGPTPSGPSAAQPGGPGGTGPMSNPNGPMLGSAVNPLQTPMQNIPSRPPPLPTPQGQTTGASGSAPPSQQRHNPTPKPKPNRQSTSNLPAPPLDDVHAAFVEFRAKEEDKVWAHRVTFFFDLQPSRWNSGGISLKC
jgi:hypothetical protein